MQQKCHELNVGMLELKKNFYIFHTTHLFPHVARSGTNTVDVDIV